ncbi:phage tail tape measure protein [Victivallis sp. Marseille-Q1083]|uniref:phage tail tape measure protein n=1 Tax=Victivallis sp. Marseille-Q1083 TaxID=2717288 RepID=UPI00158EA292|nr:phage tail tape measure protein [Victivallis sp. Marseille-Q1083]
MNSALEKLTFSVLLLDKLSGPSKGLCKSLEKVQEKSREAFVMFGKGSAALTGAVLSLNGLTGPAREFEKALGGIRSLGAAEDEIQKLGKEALKFSREFGGSAADIVESGYAIQSAFQGLENGELAKFTVNSALLARATKADAGTITGYMSTMLGVFEKDAAKIGRAEWIDRLTGKTAEAVKMFRTDGMNMQAAFAQLGAAGASKGVGMDEQMSVLGMLQTVTGSGSVAATQYRAFLGKAGEAGQKLGMNFADASGNMLPMADILDKIQARYGDTIDIMEAQQLKKAFGSDEAVAAITSMLGKTSALRDNIATLQKVSDTGPAQKMAKDLTDQLDSFKGMLNSIRVTLGRTLLPAVNAALWAASGFMSMIAWLLDNLPPLRWAFALTAIAITGFSTAWGAAMTVMGVIKFIRALGMELRIVWAWCLKNSAATHSMTFAQRLNAVTQMLWAKTMGPAVKLCRMFTWTNIKLAGALVWQNTVMIAQKVGMLVYAGAVWLLNAALLPAIAAVWAFTAALLANPVTWLVVGIVALIAAIAALVYWWDDLAAAAVDCWNAVVGAAAWCWEKLKAFFAGFGEWLLALLGPVGWIVLAFRKWDVIKDIASGVWNFVAAGFAWLWEKIRAIGTAIGDFFGWIWDGVAGGVRAALDTVLGVIDAVTGAIGKFWSWITGGGSVEVRDMRENEPVMAQATAQRRNPDVAAGGIRSSVNNRTTNYGGVTINTTAFPGPGELEDYMMLQS